MGKKYGDWAANVKLNRDEKSATIRGQRRSESGSKVLSLSPRRIHKRCCVRSRSGEIYNVRGILDTITFNEAHRIYNSRNRKSSVYTGKIRILSVDGVSR